MNCKHENKRKAGFGKVTYDYCPDCKQEVAAKTLSSELLSKAEKILVDSHVDDCLDETTTIILRSMNDPNYYGIDEIHISDGTTEAKGYTTYSLGETAPISLPEGMTLDKDTYYPEHLGITTAPIGGWLHVKESHYRILLDIAHEMSKDNINLNTVYELLGKL